MAIRKHWVLVLIPLVLSALTAGAESINRCTDANGTISYSNRRACGVSAEKVTKIEVNGAAPSAAPASAAPPAQRPGKSLKALNEEFDVRRDQRLKKDAREEAEALWLKSIEEDDERLAKAREEDQQKEMQTKRIVEARKRAFRQEAEKEKKSKQNGK